MWKIAYPTLDKIGEIIIATTRPETMLGDVAVAVHPDDERYKKLVGTRILLPIVNKEIPIIADEYVDMSYGTGAVKITPAHDPNDFEIAKRHDLPIESIISRREDDKRASAVLRINTSRSSRIEFWKHWKHWSYAAVRLKLNTPLDIVIGVAA